MIKNKQKKRIILITGGSRGIGLSAAKKFIESGDKVYFTYLNSKKNYFKRNKIFKNDNLIPIKCDMRNLNKIKKLKKAIEKEKKIDVLVNNVGDAIRRSSFEKSDDELWTDTICLNLLSTIRTTNIILPLIKKCKNSVIINVSSTAGKEGGSGDSLHYGVSKAGVNIFTIGLAKELQREGSNTKVFAIAPSLVDTDFQIRNSTKERIVTILKRNKKKSMTKPEVIGKLIYFLTTKQNQFSSGTVIYSSGKK